MFELKAIFKKGKNKIKLEKQVEWFQVTDDYIDYYENGYTWSVDIDTLLSIRIRKIINE